FVATKEQIARAAYKVASKAASDQARKFTPAAKQSGLFLKHVIPAALRPLHTLWHEVLGFVFLVFAGLGAWQLFRKPGALTPVQFVIVVIFIGVLAVYGLSSVLKARKISRAGKH